MDPLSIAAGVVAFAQVVLSAVNEFQEYARNRGIARSLIKKNKDSARIIGVIAEMIQEEIKEVLDTFGANSETMRWIGMIEDILSTLKEDLEEMEEAVQPPKSWMGRSNWRRNFEGTVTRIQGNTTQQFTLLHLSTDYHPRRRLVHVNTRIPQRISSELASDTTISPESTRSDSIDTIPLSLAGRVKSFSSDTGTVVGSVFDGGIGPTIQGSHKSISRQSSIKSGDVEASTVALIHAVHSRKKRRVAELLLAGADAQAFDTNGMSAIHYCAEKGSVSILEIICRAYPKSVGKIINQRDHFNQRTPLHVAAAHNQHEFGQRALKLGADINALDAYNNTPYMVALRQNKFEFQAIILKET